MNRDIIVTADGSHTIKDNDLNVTYHSTHGAIAESQHVYIETGLKHIQKKKLSILEIGFGTGLNALLTLIHADNDHSEILYEGVEPYPLDDVQVHALNYLSVLEREEYRGKFLSMHSCEWNSWNKISENFHLKKVKEDVLHAQLSSKYDLVYFDPFDPLSQPEIWTRKVFEKIFCCMNAGGILVTYSSKSVVRRELLAVGFVVEKVSGPHGKREIVRAMAT